MTTARVQSERRGAGRWPASFVVLMILVASPWVATAADETPADAAADAAADAPAATSAPEEVPVQAAASVDHLWFITSETREGTTRVWLAHHARAMAGPFYRTILPLARRPANLTAWDDRLWLAFEVPGRDPELFTSRILRDPLSGRYDAAPKRQLDPVRALPPGTQLEALAAGPGGPWIIGVADDGKRLGLTLTTGLWVSFEGPPVQPRPGDQVTAVTGGREAANRVVLIDGPERTPWLGRSGDPWQEYRLPPANHGEFRRLELIRIGASAVLVTTSRTSVQLDLVRPNGLARAFSWERSAETEAAGHDWTIFGMGEIARQMSRDAQGEVIWRDVNPWSGIVGAATGLELQPIDRLATLRGPLLLAVAIFVLVLLSSLRHRVCEVDQLPAGFVLASIPRRLLAQILDLLPGAIVACLVLEVTAVELIKAPLYIGSGTSTLAWIVTVAVGGIIATLTEMKTGRSMGKRLFGLEIRGDDNNGFTPRRIALRGLVRGVVLLLPILAVMVMGTPGRQGLHDLAGRTLVGRRGGGGGVRA